MVEEHTTKCDECIDDVEQGDIILYILPENIANDEYDGEEIVGGVVNVWRAEDEDNHFGETTLNVKSGAYIQITSDDFVQIQEKQAF
ncbi:hypothetical protein [Natrinema salsiterrestre]|uniref:Uncharacterized protein n=1 Tax=Natrinema salsiterrestre TaxID=2950540 RepID=A0A9Q4L650_9EURY|nr:hypothetical protein [Natrinema salsiterrestre]MDF9747613.1 hypothetical protein [Natrinema salsiterrestre]